MLEAGKLAPRRLKLDDYDMQQTLGTGTAHGHSRLLRQSQARQEKGHQGRLCRYQDPEEGGDHQAEAGGPHHL